MNDSKISALLALSAITAPIPIRLDTPLIPTAEMISTRKASLRLLKYQVALPPVLEPMGTYVGELQERWQYPSDHLAIGMTFENLNILSWNVLDAKYMSWVIENSQGLSRSQIIDEHVYIGDSELTIRDRHVVDLIMQATQQRDLLCLQECSPAFLEELRSKLPAHFEIIANHGDAILLDKRKIEIISSKEVSGVFSDAPYRTFQDIVIRRFDNGQKVRLVNIHLPGDPTKPGRFEFAEYLKQTLDPNLTTLAMGDMNFNEREMADAFGADNPFAIYSPYCTNISPYTFVSKAIDHFFVYSPNQSAVTLSQPDEVMPGLAAIVALLQGHQLLEAQ